MSLALTTLDAYRALYATSKLDVYEHRASQYGCLDAFILDTPNLVNATEIENAKQSQDHATTIPVVNKLDVTTGSTRTCTYQSDENTSTFSPLSWTTKTFGFHMVPSQYGDNYIKYAEDFALKMRDGQLKVLSELDTLAHTNLNTNKAAVNNASDNPYPVVGNTMEVGFSDREQYFNELESIMNQNDLYGGFNVVASPRVNALIRHLANQGDANATNFAYQFMGYNMHYSNRVTVAAGDMATVYAMPPGALAFLTWVDPSARMNENSGNQEWSQIFLPMLGFDVGLLYQAKCADNSTEAGNGFEASMQESCLFSFDYSFVNAYNSDSATYPGTIYKSVISKT